ncbi:MAG: hypothetical protein GVX96_04365 [Bacteroidetes bacterium]|jgi:hypothetical protein|nr:hypothetical protein [Bacteroidota bacterium]
MRVVDSFAEKGFKVTIFKTDDKYLMQIEDKDFILSWKLSSQIDYNKVKTEAKDQLISKGIEIWPDLKTSLSMNKPPEDDKKNDFPQII